MALSDDERRVLEEMERQLRAGNSDVVDITAPRRINATFVTFGVLMIVAGIAILLSGIMSQVPLIGVLGFGVMVAGVLLSTSGSRPSPSSTRSPSSPSGPAKRTRSSFEDRWDRRMGGDL